MVSGYVEDIYLFNLIESCQNTQQVTDISTDDNQSNLTQCTQQVNPLYSFRNY